MAKTSLDQFIRKASEEPVYEYVPSSLLSLNRAIGNKRGFRCGRILEFVGKPSSGKTTLALDLIAQAQRKDFACLYVDLERTFDPQYAQLLGISLEHLDIAKPDTAENTLNLVEEHIGTYRVIVVDSIPALLPKEEEEKTYDDNAKMAASAGLLTRFAKRIIPRVDTHGTLLILINQLRANISTMARVDTKAYGPLALFHALTWRIELTRQVREEDRIPVLVKVVKNKLGKEQQVSQYTLLYGNGIDVYGDILNLAIEYDIVKKAGAWFTFQDKRAQGIKNAIQSFPMEDLRKLVYERME